MAKKSKEQTGPGHFGPGEDQQLELKEPKLLILKNGSVDVPVIKDGKGTWETVPQNRWDLDYQRSLFAYWADRKAEHNDFDIEAKKAKLFMPEKDDE